MSETVFYDDKGVTVTNSRFIVYGRTYAMSGVTSVGTHAIGPSRKGPIILGIVGLVASLGGKWIAGIPLVALSIFWWTRQKPTLTILLSSASGEVEAVRSQDAGFIFGVEEALNNAIIHRG